jgi:hypothetical protein
MFWLFMVLSWWCRSHGINFALFLAASVEFFFFNLGRFIKVEMDIIIFKRIFIIFLIFVRFFVLFIIYKSFPIEVVWFSLCLSCFSRIFGSFRCRLLMDIHVIFVKFFEQYIYLLVINKLWIEINYLLFTYIFAHFS